MRKHFWNLILKLAGKDDKIIVLVGDLGFSYKEEFEKELPKQIINCGCAEQNMIGVAAGLVIQGFKPYVYSCIPFLLMRTYEFIRNDICYNNLDVKLIGYSQSGFLGFSHNLEGNENEEDLLKNLPNLKRFYPQNEQELKKVLLEKGAAYIRL